MGAIAPFASIIGSIASSIISGAIGGKDSPPPPPPLPEVKPEPDKAMESAADKLRTQRRRAASQQTLLGLSTEDESIKKTLLGQ